MTIKRSLYISNMLMLIIPVLLSLIMAGGMVGAFIILTGSHNGNDFTEKKQLGESIKEVNDLIDKWSQNPDLELMKSDAGRFNEINQNKEQTLFIYQGKELLYPATPPVHTPIQDVALSQGENHDLVIHNTTLYRNNVGTYSILLIETNYIQHGMDENWNNHRSMINLGIILLLVVLTIIFLTNRFLTRRVIKSIITPLDTLVYGVRQIRDGNLNYHIEYVGKDEFAEVCSDFNEMAQRLHQSVIVRQKDEENRKELIAGISHDLRTPLTAIKAYIEGIEKGVASTPEARQRYFSIIKSKTNDLEHIVNQLFLFSKLDIGEFPLYLEVVDIGYELSTFITNMTEEYEEKGLSITLSQNVSNCYVQVDLVQLRNAITNVLENSVKYKNKEQGHMEITCSVHDKDITIRLADDGPGVPGEVLDKLCNVFYRNDPSRTNPNTGSGIGLAITSKILERLGGSIRAENVPQGGLAIIMVLPKLNGGNRNEENINR